MIMMQSMALHIAFERVRLNIPGRDVHIYKGNKCRPLATRVFLLTPTDSNSSLVCMPPSPRKRWFLAELYVGGFTNQLFGIMSMIPVALLLNSSLIVGPVATRLSFGHSWRQFSSGRQLWIPFSHFYDMAHFSNYWKDYQLSIIEKHDIASCLHEHQVNFSVIKRPHFFAMNDKTILSWVNQSGIPLPIPNNYTYLTIQGSCNMIGIYHFWQSDSHLKLLHQVDESLKPNATLARLIDMIRSELGGNYIAAHLRIEGDSFEYKEEVIDNQTVMDSHYMKNIRNLTKHIIHHSCLFTNTTTTTTTTTTTATTANMNNLSMTLSTSTPILYISSGVFQTYYRNNTKHFLHRRANHAIKIFQKHHLNIFTQFNFSSELTHLANQLYPEQLAYVEQIISRESKCFIPSPIDTTFSYMIYRQRQLDARKRMNQTLNGSDRSYQPYETIKHHNYISWGIR